MNLLERPRVLLSPWPTPIEECPRLSAALGGPHIWIKRDDLTGLGLGGNKIRKLEYLLGEAIAQGADTVITPGALQSNHARLTAASCRRVGLEVVLVLTEYHGPAATAFGYPPEGAATLAAPPGPSQAGSSVSTTGAAPRSTRARPGGATPHGNVLLDQVFGAEIVVLEDESDEAIDQGMKDVAARLEAEGRHPYIIPVGGSNDVGTVGYVAAALEIAGQALEMGVRFDHVFVTTGSAGTHAGLHLGAALYLPGTQVHGVPISREAPAAVAKVEGLVASTAKLLGLTRGTTGGESGGLVAGAGIPPVTCHGGYVGEGYAVPTKAGWEAILLAARNEGLILDPVYTGKTMSGLIGVIREGALPTTSNVLFVHTGGSPGLLAQAPAFEEFMS